MPVRGIGAVGVCDTAPESLVNLPNKYVRRSPVSIYFLPIVDPNLVNARLPQPNSKPAAAPSLVR